MQTEGSMRIPRRIGPKGWLLPLMVAIGVALVASGTGSLVRGRSSAETPVETGSALERSVDPAEGWGFVLNADAAQVLRHRTGLEPADFVRTHAFGWKGVTISELFASPVLVRELRLQPQLSPIDLVRLEARGS